MMYTRIPVGRLVHWTDQAILFLHVAATSESDGDSGDRLTLLKTYGIHTATDLKAAHDAVVSRSSTEADGQATTAGDLDAFLFLLGESPSENGRPLARLQVILDAIEDEQWMPNLLHWHGGGHNRLRTLELDAKGNLVEVRGDPSRPAAGSEPGGDGANGARRRTAARASAPKR
jgi:hypothetical protein